MTVGAIFEDFWLYNEQPRPTELCKFVGKTFKNHA